MKALVEKKMNLQLIQKCSLKIDQFQQTLKTFSRSAMDQQQLTMVASIMQLIVVNYWD
jgi:hypothetical protein